jgi:DNA-binding NarL/FixJ family response regulator
MSSLNIIRLLIAEGNETLREAFAVFFSLQDGFEVVGLAEDSVQARDLSRQVRPDVVLVDFEMQTATLAALVRALCQESPTTKIVVLSGQLDGATREIMEAGASKYITKSLLASDVAEVIRQVNPN